MNLERFQEVIEIVARDMSDSKLITRLQAVENAYNQSISQPANVAFAEAFTNALSELESVLLASNVNRFTQGQLSALDKIGGVQKVGQGLAGRIIGIFNSDGGVAGTKLAQFQKVRTDETEFLTTVQEVRQGLSKLGLEFSPLADGEFEIDVYVPTEVVGDSLDSYQKELRNFNIHLRTLSQISGGDGSPLKLRGIGSGSLDFGVLENIAQAWAVFKLFKAIIEVYNGYLDIRLKHRQLAEPSTVKVPDKIIEDLRTYIKDSVDEKLAEVHKAFVKEFLQATDEGIRNQLSAALKLAIEFFADRLDRGARVDVILPKGQLLEEPSAEGQESAQESRYLVMKAEVPKLRNLQFTETGILGLTERVESNLNKAAKKELRKPRKAKKHAPKT